MGKVLMIALVAGIGYAAYQGMFSGKKQPQPARVSDPVADMAARLKAEQERLRAEEDARAKNWQPVTTPPAAPARTVVTGSSQEQDCAKARNNVQVTGDWMRQGGTVYDKNAGKKLSQNETFDAAARNRQYLEDNCRGR